MLLLYCNIASAVVVGIHDDSQAPVPASAYGTGIRIVPWAGLRSNLTKAGPAPPAGLADTRPYAQPTETPAILISYAGQCRFNTSTQGLQFVTQGNVTIHVNTDRNSGALINNLATYAAALPPGSPINFTQDGIVYPITAQDAINMFNALMAQVQAARNIETNCIADQNATTPQLRTYADIENAFAGLKKS